MRRFANLVLERDRITLFPLNWTIVHPIDDRSPLNGKTNADLEAMEVEFLALIQAYDESFAQEVHAAGSYVARDLVMGARFDWMYFPEDDHTVLRLDRIDALVE